MAKSKEQKEQLREVEYTEFLKVSIYRAKTRERVRRYLEKLYTGFCIYLGYEMKEMLQKVRIILIQKDSK